MERNCLNYHDVIDRPCVVSYVTKKVSKKDVRDHLTEIPASVGLSQHASAVSSLIMADWLLHYIIQNFKRFPPPEISMTQSTSFPH